VMKRSRPHGVPTLSGSRSEGTISAKEVQPQTQVRSSSRHPRSHASALTSRSCVRFTSALRTDTIDIQSPRFPPKHRRTNSALIGSSRSADQRERIHADVVRLP
jgi:hypothetical protein